MIVKVPFGKNYHMSNYSTYFEADGLLLRCWCWVHLHEINFVWIEMKDAKE